MTNISVIVGTFGDDRWPRLAQQRAIPSVERQTVPAADIIASHANSLHEARNAGAARATGEWLCFLDADDELDQRYLEAMTASIELFGLEGDWLLQPATVTAFDDGRTDIPVVIPAKPLIDGNFMVIGTLVRAEQFQRVGGFWDWPCYEDWDLWLRCWLDGAELFAVRDAYYQVHPSQGRNSLPEAIQRDTYRAIRKWHERRYYERKARPCSRT